MNSMGLKRGAGRAWCVTNSDCVYSLEDIDIDEAYGVPEVAASCIICHK